MKQRWKKLVGILLSGAMVFSLAACGGNGGDSEQAQADSGGGKKVIKFFHRFPDEPTRDLV